MSDDSVWEQPPGLTVAAVARRMGVAPATLRTWDRRYGVGPGEHQPGAHRRYGPEDVARLEHLRQLIIAGIPPAEAARAALRRSLDPPTPPSVSEPTLVAVPISSARPGGGQVVALPGGGAALRGLSRAAQALDTQACTSIVAESIDRRGVVWTWDHLVVPMLDGIGRKWSATGQGVEIEHALSSSIQDALATAVRSHGPAVNSRSVLLACVPDELHSLVLWAVGAALAERRVGARILGASVPPVALASAVQRLGPAVLFLWAQMPGSADPELVADLPGVRPAVTVLVGGPGWEMPDDALPAAATRVVDLTDTVARITHAVGG